MTRPFTLIQLSDPHLGATWAPGDARDRLAETVEWIRVNGPKPDALLVSGDLADHATDEEYGQVRELLERLAAPIHVLPGNHDDRTALRRHFGLPGRGDEPIHYAVALGDLRLIALDSTRPAEDGGELDSTQLAWLDKTLAADQITPTLVAMHHPPLTTGVPGWDKILLPRADRLALGRLVRQHPQVRRIVAGHLHRTLAGALDGQSVLVVPSTYVQAQLALGADTIPLTNEPPGFAVHALLEGELVSYVQTLPPDPPSGPQPSS
ncbi:MAG TPA: metallophosphoesterase [Solirubrobacteraceae bacterium]|nr:metallophosphoesterase [Solirubrobacteraceae bacterium]